MTTRSLFGIILLVSMVLALGIGTLPVIQIARATITGRPTVYFFNGTNITTGDPLSVPAFLGTGQYLAIDLRNTSISGAQIWVWFSKDGSATIASGDAVYIGPIYMGDVVASTPATIQVPVYAPFNKTVGDYVAVSIGYNWVNITKLPGMFDGGTTYWIKVTDVNPSERPNIPSSDVAVSTNRLMFEPSFDAYSVVDNDFTTVPNEPIIVRGYSTAIGGEYDVTVDSSVVATVSTQVITEPAVPPNPEWTWGGFEAQIEAPDLELRLGTENASSFTVSVMNNSATLASWNFTQEPRRVCIDSTPYENEGDYTGSLILNTGEQYSIRMRNFPYEGSVDIKLDNTVIATNVALDEHGSVLNYTIVIPYLPSGTYNMTFTDNDGVVYWFKVTVNLTVTPYITVEPTEGYVGDQVTVCGYNFNAYEGQNINIWFHVSSITGMYYRALNFTVPAPHWCVVITVPNATYGSHYVLATEDDPLAPQYTTTPPNEIARTEFFVKSKLVVEPAKVSCNGEMLKIIGTGFPGHHDYDIIIDMSYFYLARSDDYGFLHAKVPVTGCCCGGVHSVALYDSSGPAVPVAVAYFNVTGPTLQDVMNRLDSINGSLVSIQGDIAVIQTQLGDVRVGIDDLKAMITSMGDEVLLKLDDMNSSLANLVITKNGEVVATITAQIDELRPIIRDINNGVATIQTNLGTVMADASAILGNQARILELVVVNNNTLAVIQTKVGEVLASINAVNDLINSKVLVDTGNILSKLDSVMGSLADIKSMSTDVKGGINDIKNSLSGLNGKVDDLSGKIDSSTSTLSSKIDKSTGDLSSKIDNLGTSITDKLSKSTGDLTNLVNMYGITSIILIIIAIVAALYGAFRKKP
ncbi:methyl-accepting chemotaxis protein [Staphylothermus hellenicus]|uniref:Putative methyl-accepting chemotaxis sensory transducer n=1 Tax=Staphylothermus hellenicus (strain DSM 12710 / JCM 10830 / BK20S6-10-b1 / P8) TaxID=591019 RepID=D7D997_STAHD|nr:methyl-accepting chemotaxis protein [Staphylothermus hellenicus]ADI32343.1 putative methyl-accepting chemotaxis sensory transducer [Staphylothermus hellenicus DSM 12710]